MKRQFLIIVILIILAVALIIGYLYWKSIQQPEKKAAEPLQKSIESAASAGTLPDIAPVSNPLEKMPQLNPIEETNPFKNLKTNPFE